MSIEAWSESITQAAHRWLQAHGVPADRSTTANDFLVECERIFWLVAGPEAEPGARRPSWADSALKARSDQLRADFGDDLNGRHFVYVIGLDGQCLYVGMTSDILGRLRAHSGRFAHADAVDVAEFASRAAAAAWEKRCIRSLQPAHNIRGR